MLDKIKQIFKKPKSDIIPLTGGSIFSDMNTLINSENIMLNSLKNQLANNINNDLYYQYWQILDFHCDFFINQFQLKNINDMELLNDILLCFKMVFYNGNGLIFVDKNQHRQVFYIIKKNYDVHHELKSIEVGYAQDFINFRHNIEDIKKNNNTVLLTKTDLAKCAYIDGFKPYWIKWLPFCKLQTELLKIINNLQYFLNKKILINVNDPNVFKEEIQLYFDNNNPFLINIEGDNLNGNKFVPKGLITNSNEVEPVLNYYVKTISFYYELLGRRIEDASLNKANIIKNQVNASQKAFDILNNNEYLAKKIFIDKLNSLINTNIQILDFDTNLEDKQTSSGNGDDNEI